MGYLLLALFVLIQSSAFVQSASPRLGTFNVLRANVTISGGSSGAAMVTQLHVAYSSVISGSAPIAGPPYKCLNGNLITSTAQCMTSLISMPGIYNTVFDYQIMGLVDDVKHLSNGRAFVFSGLLDLIVPTLVVRRTEEFYKNYMKSSNVKTVYNIPACHGFLTDNFGGFCSIMSSNFINNCNYAMAYELLNFLYNEDNIRKPTKNQVLTGRLYEFDQTEFFPASSGKISMDDTGYVYVPTNCLNGKRCKLHVALHGCGQGVSKIGTDFVLKAGFNQVADLNDLIIVYPQVIPTLMSSLNPLGCWDWMGYTDSNYANNKGLQMQAVKAMIDRVTVALS